MEGKGFPWEKKNEDAFKAFVGAFAFFTMNTLPPQLEEEGPLGEPDEVRKER